MTRMLLSLPLVLLLACASAAQELADQYVVEGANPGGGGKYRGNVAVTQTGETYQVAWSIGRQKYVGTGVLEGDVFSVVFQPQAGSAGIAVYKLKGDRSLDGVWTNLAGSALGSENWRPDQGL